ncbi:hypothetical protein J4I25_004026 [Salmonella enterica]|uniref:Uncharacterized protein n=2 Tax=Salmonella enterica TaxID=28901 RepID=A0A5V1J0C8_SALER|nr:hypothetical protein [Salmonella enterica]EDX4411849.1 hypothetical protein [Salmonella enterica subsp. houtenae serovar 44:z36,[z38]:-]HAC6493925.1 hypothetical protein [Salmonella enterica subsp. houtenae serovar 44:z36[z38]:-]EAS2170467.1 hypothetical protein [Salmonella enterica]EAY1801606.1 hypothetical protein [Salmonella enterica]
MGWLCVTLSLCATKVTHWSGAVRERSRILVQVYGHAAANALRQMQAAARKVKGAGVAAGAGVAGKFSAQIKSADNQQVRMSREIREFPVVWIYSR